MRQETPDVFNWQEWDWRPLARFVGWMAIAAVLGRVWHVSLLALLGRTLTAMILLSVLSFGMLTHLLLLGAMGAWQFAMAFDDVAYALAERIVRPALGRATFAANFFAAFCVEIGLVFGAGAVLRAAHADARLWAALSGVLR